MDDALKELQKSKNENTYQHRPESVGAIVEDPVSINATKNGRVECDPVKLIVGCAMSAVGVYVPVSYSSPLPPPPLTLTIAEAKLVTSKVPLLVMLVLPLGIIYSDGIGLIVCAPVRYCPEAIVCVLVVGV